MNQNKLIGISTLPREGRFIVIVGFSEGILQCNQFKVLPTVIVKVRLHLKVQLQFLGYKQNIWLELANYRMTKESKVREMSNGNR